MGEATRSRFMLALVVMLSLTAAACGGGGSAADSSADPGDETGTADRGSESGEDDQATQAQALVDELEEPAQTGDEDPPTDQPSDEPAAPSGSLRVGLATDLQTLDPHLAQPSQLHFLTPVYDSLTRIGNDGGVKPAVATTIESDDQVVWTISLDETATFADGSAIDADAVAWSLERGIATPESPSAGVFSQITSIEVTDAATLTLMLASPNLSLPRDLAGLAGMIVNPATGDADIGREPAGSGPFAYDGDASVDGVEYRYTSREDYWGPAPGVEELAFAIFSDPTARVNALQSGEVDMAAELGPNEQATIAGAFELVRSTETEPLYLQILDSEGTIVPAFADQRVRQAMSLAIDRVGITNALFLGAGIPTTGFWVAGSPYYSAAVDDTGYDPDRARALLTEAGLPDGFEFSVGQVEPTRSIAEAVQASLSQVGITMNIELQQIGTLGGQMRGGEWPGNVTIARGYTADGFFAERLGTDAPFNAFGTDRSRLDALAEEARNASSDADASAAWAAVYEQAITDGYIIVITHIATAAGVADNVSGAFTPPGSLIPDVRQIRVDA
jgi:peptide/nickel transport system substrate-binding protein